MSATASATVQTSALRQEVGEAARKLWVALRDLSTEEALHGADLDLLMALTRHPAIEEQGR